MKYPDPIKQEEILGKSYVSVNDLYELYPMGYHACRKLHHLVVEELEQAGIPLLPTKPVLVPLKRVLRHFPVDRKAIERASDRLREIKKGAPQQSGDPNEHKEIIA